MTGPGMTDGSVDADAIAVARRVADEVLAPAADALDRSGERPVAQLRALADAGLYGLAGPAEAGGWDCDAATSCGVVEILAAACLTTTFVWIQHHAVVRALRRAADPRHGALLAELCGGRRRGGVVLAALRPGPASPLARSTRGGWSLSGTVPWFTGWGEVDVALVAARAPDEQVLLALLDLASLDRTLRFVPERLLAVEGSSTGSLAFEETPVGPDRVVGLEARGDWSDDVGLRLNGALGLGVASRCLAELAGDRPHPELDRLRARLHEVDGEGVASVRAAIAAFASRCAAALLAGQGSNGMRADGTAARRYREAGFLLTFGQRPAIKAELLERLGPGASSRVDP